LLVKWQTWTRSASKARRLAARGWSGATQRWLRDLGERAAALTPLLRECGAPNAVIARCEDRIARVGRALGAVSA